VGLQRYLSNVAQLERYEDADVTLTQTTAGAKTSQARVKGVALCYLVFATLLFHLINGSICLRRFTNVLFLYEILENHYAIN